MKEIAPIISVAKAHLHPAKATAFTVEDARPYAFIVSWPTLSDHLFASIGLIFATSSDGLKLASTL